MVIAGRRVISRGRIGEAVVVPVVFVLFFTSGFAALLYQVIWQRVLAIFSGADVYSVTIIVAAFMAGLGCGSLAGGYIADRVSLKKRIILFALSEAAIALFAVVSTWLYYSFLYQQHAGLARSPVILAAVLFLSLLWPTFFMGMSLPLLAKVLTRSVEGASRMVGALYGLNALGAAIGAFATPWFLIRLLGFETAVLLGAGLNLLAALGAFAVTPLLLRTARQAEEASSDEETAVHAGAQAATDTAPFPTWVWVAIYGLSGFIALSLEIVWFRLLGVMLKSNAFTFGSLLATYLLGLAFGTLRGLAWARESKRPALVFFALQAAIPVYAALSVIVLVGFLGNGPALGPLWEYFGQYETLDLQSSLDAVGGFFSSPYAFQPPLEKAALDFISLYVLLPLALVGPPTLMMGMSFPFLQKVVQRDVATLGRRVGWLQTANIFGSMLGAILTGWVFLLVLGTANTLKLLLLFGVFFLLLLARELFGRSREKLAFAGVGATALVALLFWAIPPADVLWAKLHASTPDQIIVAEDGSGLSLMKIKSESVTEVYANGLGQSTIPFPTHHTDLGLLPALVHPDPKEIAIIGLGSGATLHGAGGRPETMRIDCIEIVAPQLATLQALQARRPYGGLQTLLEDDRIHYTFSDGRAVIMLGGRKYDIIEADALRPTSSYSGNLYSHQYFTLLRENLKPGGFAVTWAPTERTKATFLSVFPHVLVSDADAVLNVLIGSDQPIAWDPDEIRRRAQHPFTQEHYKGAGVDLEARAAIIASSNPQIITPDMPRSTDNLNSDLYPRDEYQVP